MQTLAPLTLSDFEKPSTVVISKVEVDIDGAGDFQELPDLKSCAINTNEENRVAKLCSHSFSIVCLNTDDRYGSLNSGSAQYGWLKQGRQIKLYAGIKKNGTEYFYQYLLGRIDEPKLSKKGGEEICTITGRCLMRMLLEYKLYFPDTYWGTDHDYNTVADQMTYNMEADCKGIYKVYLDSTALDGSALEEIFEGRDWTYDWNLNKLVFVSRKAPADNGTNNLKVYYFQTQDIEDVVGDLLLGAGILADGAARTAWLASAYCTATGETIDRVSFRTATLASKAVTLLAEVAQYRFYFDFKGNPIFRAKDTIGAAVKNLEYSELKIVDETQKIEEVYTHVIVIGETRDRIVGDDETAPAVPSNLALSTGFGEYTQAGLAYVKATWDANTESDFGHYELRIKKNADSDYSEVSTIATSYMFLGLEPGVTYNVQIRACDIYENRSAWSSAEDQVTATDADTPAQITGETATAIVGGVKIEWTKGSEDNLSYYLVERQESPDNIDWSAGWVEISRINGDMWLDLLLTYSKYYRYRITAYTVTGTAGVTSANTTAVQPSKTGASDIVAKCLTAAQIYGLKLSVIFADMGQITAGDITLDSNGFIRTDGKDNYADDTAGIWFGYDTDKYKLYIGDASEYIKWTGTALSIKGSIDLVNTIDWQTDIAGTGKPDDNADVTLAAINGELSVTGGGIVLSSTSPKIRAGQTAYATGTGFWLGMDSGTPKFSIGSATQYMKWTGAALSIKGSITLVNTIPNAKVDGLGDLALEDAADWQTQVDGANKPDNNADVTLAAINGELSITGGGIVLASSSPKIRAGQTAYGTGTGFWLGLVAGTPKFSIGSSTKYMKWSGAGLTIKGITSADALSVLNANIGTITAGLIDGAEFRVGGYGSNQEIYFKDSGIYMYDALSGSYKKIGWKYGALVFSELTRYTNLTIFSLFDSTTAHMKIYQGPSGVGTKFNFTIGAAVNYIEAISNTALNQGFFKFHVDYGFARDFIMWNTGVFVLPNLPGNPASGETGGICMVAGRLKFWNGSVWKLVAIV